VGIIRAYTPTLVSIILCIHDIGSNKGLLREL
jgi:hypothetical protein